MLKFRDLAIGDGFIFQSEVDPDPIIRHSGMARGPWVKRSARKYDHTDTDGLRDVRVGSINVEVIRKSA